MIRRIRMHSSKMRTARFSGRLRECTPPPHNLSTTLLSTPLSTYLLPKCTLAYTPHYPSACWDTDTLVKCMLVYAYPSTIDRMTNMRLWIHHLRATSFVGGKNYKLNHDTLNCRYWKLNGHTDYLSRSLLNLNICYGRKNTY